ncbi:MAG: PAS domain-containing sensor histidine kinase [Nitrososphaera sp.]
MADKEELHAEMVTKRGIFGSRREEIIESLYNQVRELEARYRKLYEGSPEMHRTIDIDGFVVDCNHSYVENLGYANKGEVVGHSLFEHTAEEGMEAMRNSFKEWQLTGKVHNKEVFLKRKDSSTFPALINASSLYDDGGHLVGSNTVITDMTEIYKARDQLQVANQELKKAQEIREDFIRIAAHELRTPIQPILLAADMAKRNPTQQTLALDIIVKEAKRLKELANDLLDTARIESGSLTYEKRRIRASEIVAEIVDDARLCVSNTPGSNGQAASPVSIVADTNGDGVALYVDRVRIIQALSNLVNNSIKFTSEGQIAIKTCVLPDKKFEIKVTDTGPGISAELLPRLFEKFVTKDLVKTSSKQHGSGLGLFISKSIIQAHGGDITAYNNPYPPGATFVVRLPITAD